ncbi:hypothetical protein ILYODFUR_019414 [Ilyodon furcidens]|uniref:Uncharacterized protein n=1 Tax=Ilyodon furcidens TaxID=33524 RepID=A0ABV0SYE3_9TELE
MPISLLVFTCAIHYIHSSVLVAPRWSILFDHLIQYCFVHVVSTHVGVCFCRSMSHSENNPGEGSKDQQTQVKRLRDGCVEGFSSKVLFSGHIPLLLAQQAFIICVKGALY